MLDLGSRYVGGADMRLHLHSLSAETMARPVERLREYLVEDHGLKFGHGRNSAEIPFAANIVPLPPADDCHETP
jgi:hypothetical protein